jgi:hypothetical protein
VKNTLNRRTASTDQARDNLFTLVRFGLSWNCVVYSESGDTLTPVSAICPAKSQRQLSYSTTRQTRSLADIDLPVYHDTGLNNPLVTLVDMLVIVMARVKGWSYWRIRGTMTLLAKNLFVV